MKRPYLDISHITKYYNQGQANQITALDDFSLTLKSGEFVTVVGSNAAGKSTLFNIILGSLRTDIGRIYLDGKEITKLPQYTRSRYISCVYQNPNDGIVPSMTVAENLAMAKLRTKSVGLGLGIKRGWKDEFRRLLESFRLGLEDRLDEQIGLLSGGQKQVVALLMATISHPKILLLDEHTASLDPEMSSFVLKNTRKLIEDESITTIMITHNIDYALRFGSRLVLLESGKNKFEIGGIEKENASVLSILEKMEKRGFELQI